MEEELRKPTETEQQKSDDAVSSPSKQWVAPELTFVEPKLTNHGALTKVTGQFFGAFSPRSGD